MTLDGLSCRVVTLDSYSQRASRSWRGLAWLCLIACCPSMVHGQATSADETTRAALESALAEFSISAEEDANTRELLSRLDAPRYEDRRTAFATLLARPSLPTGLIKEIRQGASTNQRMMIDQILTLNDDSQAEARLVVLLQRIANEGIRGLGSNVLRAVDGRNATDPVTVDWAQRAMKATVLLSDMERIRHALKSKTTLVRRAALAGIAELLGEAEVDLLLALRDDADDAIRFRIAILLAEHKHRECLAVFASLLQSEVFAYRIQSADALILLTGQDFGYLADAILEQRQGPADLWRRWVKKFGTSADVAFDDFTLMEEGFGQP